MLEIPFFLVHSNKFTYNFPVEVQSAFPVGAQIPRKDSDEAQQQMQNVGQSFISENNKVVKHELNMVNLVVHNERAELLDRFKFVVKEYFKGEVQTADFENNAIEETNKVNEWVSNQTNHKIRKVFDSLKADTMAVIANVLYFRGEIVC